MPTLAQRAEEASAQVRAANRLYNAALEHLQAAVEGVQTAQAQERLAQDAVLRTRRIRDEADNRLFQVVEEEEEASRAKRQRQDEAAVGSGTPVKAETSATSSETSSETVHREAF